MKWPNYNHEYIVLSEDRGIYRVVKGPLNSNNLIISQPYKNKKAALKDMNLYIKKYGPNIIHSTKQRVYKNKNKIAQLKDEIRFLTEEIKEDKAYLKTMWGVK